MKTFAQSARPFIEDGRFPASDLIPIIPPGAPLTAQSRLDETQLGKIPGRYDANAKAWSGLGGNVLVEGLTPGQQRRVGSWPTENVGLRAAAFPAVDIDVRSERARDIVESVALDYLGSSPIRERGSSPRTLLVFRAAGEAPIRKMRLLFTLDGEQHAVDVLGWGQQYLIAGTHPSGDAYHWREGHQLTVWGVDGLATVTSDDMRAFFEHLSIAIEAKGGEIVSRANMAVGSTSAGEDYRDLPTVAPPEVLVSAMRAIPNTAEEVPHRGDLVGIVSSVKAAMGKEADAHYSDYMDWACEHGWASMDYANHIWESVRYVRAAPDSLFRRARKYGWHGDAAFDFNDGADVERGIDEAQARQRNHLETVAKQVVYWPAGQNWIVVSTGEMLTHAALSYHPVGMALAPAGTTGVKSASALLRNSRLVRDVVGVSYLPGQPPTVEWTFQGVRGLWFNRWRPGIEIPGKDVLDSDVQPWLDHIADLFPTEEERAVLLDWMAHLLQHPGVKVRWAPVIVGAQGVGKDLMLKPLLHALGDQNVQEISPHMLADKYTSYYESQLIVVQEMLRMDKVEVYERVKAAVTGTGAGTVIVRRLYQEGYPVPNTAAFVFLTNHTDAISLAPDDRRFYVVQAVRNEPREDAYYAALADWYEAGGKQLVARWLKARDVSAFKPDRAPEWTEAKRNMLEESLPAFASWMLDQVQGEGGRFHGRAVLASEEIRDAILSDYAIPHKIRDAYSPKAVGLAMRTMGWVRPAEAIRTSDGKRMRVWCSPEMAAANPKVLAARFAAEKRRAGVDFDVA